jgi:choline dehydrogenase
VYRSQVAIRAASGVTALGWDLHILPYQAEGELAVLVFFMAPGSRGRVDGDRSPRIRFRFFEGAGAIDLDALVAGVERAREVTAHFNEASEVGPITRGGALRRWVRANVTSYSHASGTCRMGTDEASVVDPRCRVRGFENLSIADASILPRIPRANTNLLCLLVGTRAAQLLSQ